MTWLFRLFPPKTPALAHWHYSAGSTEGPQLLLYNIRVALYMLHTRVLSPRAVFQGSASGGSHDRHESATGPPGPLATHTLYLLYTMAPELDRVASCHPA